MNCVNNLSLLSGEQPRGPVGTELYISLNLENYVTIPGLKRLVPGIIDINWFHFLNRIHCTVRALTWQYLQWLLVHVHVCVYVCFIWLLSYLVCRWLWLCVCSPGHQVREGVCSEGTKLLPSDILLLLLCGGVAEFALYTLYMNVIGYMV